MLFIILFLLFAHNVFAQLNPKAAPGSNFDLRAWNLHALRDDFSFFTVKPAQLAAGYQSKFFYTDTVDGAMVFKTPANGRTTVSTSHPRIELRQTGDGANWPLADTNEHILSGVCVVESVAPDTPKTVIGQIHGGEKVSQLLKLIWAGDKNGKCNIRANFKNNDAGKKDAYVQLAKGLSLGDTVSYTLSMKSGIISVTVNGNSCSHAYTEEYFGKEDRYYFKAGNYLQCSSEEENIFGIVKFYKLDIIR